MKLAEALQQRADINNKITKLREKMENNVLVQEGEKPDFDIAKLIEEHDELTEERTKLIDQINWTNIHTSDEETEKSIAELITYRDELKTKMSTYQTIIDKIGEKRWRTSGSEIKTISTVKAKDIQKKYDEAAKLFRQIDNKIQMLNWATDLEDPDIELEVIE